MTTPRCRNRREASSATIETAASRRDPSRSGPYRGPARYRNDGSSRSPSGLTRPCSRPRWMSARPGPYKTPGIEVPFLSQAVGTPIDRHAIFFPSRRSCVSRSRESWQADVRLLSGHFADLVGRLERLDGASRARVLVSVMNGEIAVTVQARDLAAA